ncbi:MAG TPA: PadR family transcriptional regulator [Thermoanaerobaculia bacterium]|nr:PadR family transcriptional regulator [Thermoanaerobaculia bacterium]
MARRDPPSKVTHSAAVILQALARGYRHGFDVIELTGLQGGTVYPVLRRLERDGLVRSRWERAELAQQEGRPPRRYYQVTAAGRTALAEALERFRFLRPFAEQLPVKET